MFIWIVVKLISRHVNKMHKILNSPKKIKSVLKLWHVIWSNIPNWYNELKCLQYFRSAAQKNAIRGALVCKEEIQDIKSLSGEMSVSCLKVDDLCYVLWSSRDDRKMHVMFEMTKCYISVIVKNTSTKTNYKTPLQKLTTKHLYKN